MSTSKRKMDRLVKGHRRWLQETAQEVYHRSCEWLNTDLLDSSLHCLRKISISLDSLATFHGIHGLISLIDKNPSGWEQVHHSCLLHRWVLKIESSLYQRLAYSSNLTRFVPRAACNLAYAIVCGLDDWRMETADLLSQMATEANMMTEDYWQERRLEPFMIRLNQIIEGEPLDPKNGESFGAYSDVLSQWNNEGALADALIRACDYHSENLDDRGNWDPEFDEAPFDLIPWEILAIQQVRRKMGLPLPQIIHPLANPFLIQSPTPGPIQDEFLPRVERLFHDYFPWE